MYALNFTVYVYNNFVYLFSFIFLSYYNNKLFSISYKDQMNHYNVLFFWLIFYQLCAKLYQSSIIVKSKDV